MPASAHRRQLVLLAALVVALVAVMAYQFSGGPRRAAPIRGGSAPRAATMPAPVASALEPVPELRLAALDGERPRPASGRNLFRDRPAPPPPAPPSAVAPVKPDPNAPPPPPPPPPPITLKFIGLVQARDGTVAVFTDGRDVFYGREGEVIEGRYRIIRIGVESVEMSYVDGRGRQRIPLTG